MLSSSIYRTLLSFIITFFFHNSLAFSTFVTDYEIDLLDRLSKAVDELDRPTFKNTEQAQSIRRVAKTVQVDEKKSLAFSQAVESTVNNALDDFFDENVTRAYFNFLSYLPAKYMDDFTVFYSIVTVKLNPKKHQDASITYFNTFLEKMPEAKKELTAVQLLSLVKIIGHYPVFSIIPERFNDPKLSAHMKFANFSLVFAETTKHGIKHVTNAQPNWKVFKQAMQNTKI